MARPSNVQLDSYRLAQYTVSIPCYICGEGNTYDAELCRTCSAPMALAHQANAQQVRPRLIAVIGPSGVGKTVYLGMLLDMLSRQPKHMQMLARGAFSITLQQTVVSALSRCEFPQKTPNEPDRWNWVHCQVRRPQDKQPVELVMPDLAGESLLHEVDHPNSYPVIHSLLERAAGVLVLIDASELQSGSRDQDYFTMKLLTYLAELPAEADDGWRQRPVALVFTKADQCEECFLDSEAYARSQAAGLWQHCQERFARRRFFAAGVAGSCAYREIPGYGRIRVPLRIEPRGIVEPFAWLVDQIRAAPTPSKKKVKPRR